MEIGTWLGATTLRESGMNWVRNQFELSLHLKSEGLSFFFKSALLIEVKCRTMCLSAKAALKANYEILMNKFHVLPFDAHTTKPTLCAPQHAWKLLLRKY